MIPKFAVDLGKYLLILGINFITMLCDGLVSLVDGLLSKFSFKM
jgi:hypothetical protein